MTAFAGVRIEPANQNPRLGYAEFIDQVRMQNPANPDQSLLGNGIRHRAQRQVRGHQRHPQAVGGEHHHHLFGVGQIGQKLGVAGEGNACLIDHALVHRGGDHGGKVAVDAALGGALQGFEHIGGIGGVELAGGYWCLQRGVPDIQAAGCSRLGGPGVRADRQQLNIKLELAGAGGQQFKAGDGDQGLRLWLCGEQQAQVWTYAGRFTWSYGKAPGLHSLVST